MLHELADRACVWGISWDSTSSTLVQIEAFAQAGNFNLKRQGQSIRLRGGHTMLSAFAHLADCNFQIKGMGKLIFAMVLVYREEKKKEIA